MKTTSMFILLVALVLSGCDLATNQRDNTPPAPPTGLYTETGDNFIDLFWNKNPERDVSGYNVYVSSSYDGRYELIGSSHATELRDGGARNGNKYYYGVTAYDVSGNESGLSRDFVYDIPRPEGYGVFLDDYRRFTKTSGYDFSHYTVVPYDDQYTDMYFEYYQGVYYMNVRTDSDIQDLGPTRSILEIKNSPTTGWSSTHDVRLRVGHTYVVWTWDDHYAKFRVASLSASGVVFDWAYQLQKGNTMLKRPAGSGAYRPAIKTNPDRTK